MAGDKTPKPALTPALTPAPWPGVEPVAVPALAPPGGHYSPGCRAAGLVFVSGQLPIAPDGTRLVGAPFDMQVALVLANVAAVLHAAGSGIGGLVQVRVYLDDIAHWPRFDELYRAWAGAARPARCVVPTRPLHFGFLIEVEAVALASAAPASGLAR